jgi:hypothetical protein
VSDPEDIVTRLRAVLHNDRSVELMNREAADEIERLRADVMCLKYQNAEFVRNLTMAQDERNAAVAERDEARRELCRNLMGAYGDEYKYAKHRGWDCFKKDGK